MATGYLYHLLAATMFAKRVTWQVSKWQSHRRGVWGGLQVIAATNRADILDPALMRSGRLDRKIEFPHPTEDARAKILQVPELTVQVFT